MSETMIIHLLICGEHDGRCVVGAFENPADAHAWLGRAAMAGQLSRGPFELETCEFEMTPPIDQPTRGQEDDVVDALTEKRADQDAVAGVLRRLVPDIADDPEGCRMAAREIVKVMAQRMADVRSMARQDVEARWRSVVAQLQDALASEPAAERIVELGDALGMVRELVREVIRMRRKSAHAERIVATYRGRPVVAATPTELDPGLEENAGRLQSAADALPTMAYPRSALEIAEGVVRCYLETTVPADDLDRLMVEAERPAALETETEWHNLDGRVQERILAVARNHLGMPAPAAEPKQRRRP